MNSEIFDNIKEVVKDTAQTISKKSGELVEKSKIQYEIFDLNRDVKKLYCEIGKLTYRSVECDEDNSAEIQEKCDIAKAKLAKIEILRNGEDEAEFACPVCGKPNNADSSYCSSCGVNMAVDVECDIADVEDEEE